jgi:hypothetical protein
MCYWAGLYPGETQELIMVGVDMAMKTAIALLLKKQNCPAMRMIADGCVCVCVGGGGGS